MLKFGASESDVTPKGPIDLAGFGYFLDRMSNGVDGKLKATAVAVEGDNGKLAVMCSVDLLSVDDYVVRTVQDTVSAATGRPDLTLMINASHTHSGPSANHLYGVGTYEPSYVDEVVIPKITEAAMKAVETLAEGEIGINRDNIDYLSFNRANNPELDTQLTALRIDTDNIHISGANFPAHPVVFGKDSRVVSSDYPGVVREVLHAKTHSSHEIWQTGFAGDINPMVNRHGKSGTNRDEAIALGTILGHHASELYSQIETSTGRLQTLSTSISLPVDTAFELDPMKETEVYRVARELPNTQDMSGLTQWYEVIAPIVNGNDAETIQVPMTVVAIGKYAFVGLGAEIYSGTGIDLQTAHPELEIIGIMNSNEHQGYIPRLPSYKNGDYAARASSFIFGRKPLTPDSEAILRKEVSAALDTLTSTA